MVQSAMSTRSQQAMSSHSSAVQRWSGQASVPLVSAVPVAGAFYGAGTSDSRPQAVQLPTYECAAPALSGSQRQFRILCYGDSNTVGYTQQGRHYQPYGEVLSQTLAAAGKPAQVTACGLCGVTAKDLAAQIYSEVITPRAGPRGKGLVHVLEEDGPFDLVIIMAGTNDLGGPNGNNTVDIQAHLSRLHVACHVRGIPTVSLAPPAALTVPGSRLKRQPLVSLMSTWANSTPGVLLFLDVEDILPRSETSCWSPDEIHLTAHGSKELGRRITPKLASVLGRPKPAVGKVHSESKAPAGLSSPRMPAGPTAGVVRKPGVLSSSSQIGQVQQLMSMLQEPMTKFLATSVAQKQVSMHSCGAYSPKLSPRILSSRSLRPTTV